MAMNHLLHLYLMKIYLKSCQDDLHQRRKFLPKLKEKNGINKSIKL